jgi:hypothetical protein
VETTGAVPEIPAVPTAEQTASEEEITSLDALMGMLNEIPVKGQVWIAGDALDGLESAETLELYLSVLNDKGAISNFMKRNIPELHGQFLFKQGPPPPEVKSVLAVGGGM